MKKLLLCSVSFVLLYSCQNDMVNDMEADGNMTTVASVTETTVDSDNGVHWADIQNYLQKRAVTRNEVQQGESIEVVTYHGDTVMYLVNYAEGWEMLPGDKRYPLKVAFNEHETLNMDEMNDAQKAWFDNLAEEIHCMKLYGDSIETEYSKEWSMLSNQQQENPISLAYSEDRSGWILHNVREIIDEETQDHLLTTDWVQSNSYNIYCPYNSYRTAHCLVGCVAVAGGQVLNYLHNYWGVPENTVTGATYDEATNTYSFSGWDSYPWDYIQQGNKDYIALLLGYVGVLCEMNYGDSGSGSDLYSKLPNALQAYGIECSSKDSWDSTIIKRNIKNGLPVLARMHGYDAQGEDVGHAIVIDGYKYETYYYTNVYIYVENLDTYPGDIYDHVLDENTGSAEPYPEEGPTYEVSYKGGTKLYYMVNWGYGDSDDTYYLSTSDLKYNYYSGTITFDHNKAMLYDYSIK